MPRLIKREFHDTIGKPLQNVSDDMLRVIEYAGIGYMVDNFVGVSKDKNTIMKWVGFSIIALTYESFLENYGTAGESPPIPNMKRKV
tara:strand:- start:1862 stop:2122 length:261 start_codon:yes stop_codon:yes gene_type:complete